MLLELKLYSALQELGFSETVSVEATLSEPATGASDTVAASFEAVVVVFSQV